MGFSSTHRDKRLGVLLIFVSTLVVGLVLPRPVAAAPIFSDNFNSNSINPNVWRDQIFGTGPSVSAINQSVVVTIASNSVGDPALGGQFLGGLSSVCLLRGDFDMQVDYNLLVWPSSSGIRVGLRFTEGAGHAVERVGWGATESLYYPREVYLTDFQDRVQGVTGTSDLNGTLRMVRTGSTLTGYYHDATGWVAVHSGPTQDQAGDVHFGPSVWGGGPTFVGQSVKIGFDNFVISSGQIVCPGLTLNPTSGPIGTKVQVQGTGFSPPIFGPGNILVTFDDQLIGVTNDPNGTFTFTFNIPFSQAGPHLVKASDQNSGTTLTATFIVTRTDSLSLSVDVGSLYFPSETASIYTLATLSGTPLNSTALQLSIVLMKPDGSNISLANTLVGSGLFKSAYAIPKTGPIGTYSVIVRGHVANVQDASAITTFEVKLPWLSSQAQTVIGGTVAVAGIGALGAVLWRTRVFRNKNN